MKRLIAIIAAAVMLTGCFDYVEPRETYISVTEAHSETVQATESDFQTETEEIAETDTETETETYTETERETVTAYIYTRVGANIREQANVNSEKLDVANFGESIKAFKDTFDDEWVEIVYYEGTAFIHGTLLTVEYDEILRIRQEIADEARRAAESELREKLEQQDTETPETPQRKPQEATEATETETQTETTADVTTATYSASTFKQAGVLYWGGSKWTWYTQRQLPGYGLEIPGRHLDESGYVCDGDGYIVCAADLSYIARYTIIETPFGKLGKIYDTGCAYGVIDVYTDW